MQAYLRMYMLACVHVTVRVCVHVTVRVFVRVGLCVCACAVKVGQQIFSLKYVKYVKVLQN